MDSEILTKRFINNNLLTYGIEWINTDRANIDFNFLIYGRPSHGRQIGLYGDDETILRLEEYDQSIDGVDILPKCSSNLAVESECSNFKHHKGVCVKVDSPSALKKLMDWYYPKIG